MGAPAQVPATLASEGGHLDLRLLLAARQLRYQFALALLGARRLPEAIWQVPAGASNPPIGRAGLSACTLGRIRVRRGSRLLPGRRSIVPIDVLLSSCVSLPTCADVSSSREWIASFLRESSDQAPGLTNR